ncbi:MAG: hypothetical protein KIT44_07775 [Opitutaceae bacterium]|nr:hypothetical protein [Opitutaceae bacterium]
MSAPPSCLQTLYPAAPAALAWHGRWGAAPATTPAATVGHRVLRTALKELATALADHTQEQEIILGRPEELPQPQPPAVTAKWQALRPADDRDTFAILVHAGTLHLLGSTPRGVLQAVFHLEEARRAGEALGEGFCRHGTLQFAERIFHPRFAPWPGERADVRFLARLGATHALVAHDWQGSRRSLQGYVTSPVFPTAVDPTEVAANHAGLRRLLDDCADHGLGAMLWLTELPCQGGPWVPEPERQRFLERFPAEVLSDSGTYEGKVLCFSHPRVQEFYRDLLARFFADFPEIEALFVFGLDSGGEFCDPETCPRCRGRGRFHQRDRLLNFLISEGRKARPNLRVLTTGWKWDRDSETFLLHQTALPAATGVYLAAQKDGWQCERQAHDFMREVRHICRERGQTFIGYDNFHWGDDTVHRLGDIQDFPLGIAAKVRRWHALGADGVFDHWGNAPEDIWCNSIALREFFLNPQADAAAVCLALAHRQFGAAAGEPAFAAWHALERAHVALSPACLWSPEQWPGWYAGRKQPPLPGPNGFGPPDLVHTRQPPRREDDQAYNPEDFGEALQAVADAWEQAAPYYAEAARQLQAAESVAGDEPVFYHFWWNGAAPSPTRREHLRRQRLYVESMGLAGREIGRHFGLHALWIKCGCRADAYRRLAGEALQADAAACRHAADFFTTLGAPKDWGRLYAEKAAAIESYLAGR